MIKPMAPPPEPTAGLLRYCLVLSGVAGALGVVSMTWAIGKKKFDFVGKRGLERPDLVADNRKQFVGLLTKDPKVKLEEGAQITTAETPATGTPAEGHG